MMYYFALPMCIFVPLSFHQSDESDESSEEETATDNGEESLSDGKKSSTFLYYKCKKGVDYQYKS